MYIHSKAKNITEWFQSWQDDTSVCSKCICNSVQKTIHGFTNLTELVMFSLDSNNIPISKTVKVTQGNKSSVLPLQQKCIVYLGDFHFTTQLISNKNVRFHDGQVTKNKCKYEGHISDFDDKKLHQCIC
ncbi:hypothetical protein L208DRAFT_1327257 [Tricholoma matsutake]|nr:hypothetical protein L208DRAFT_1327257 [Tricholoma matsutake 945]